MSSCCPISGNVTSKDIATNNFAAKAGTVCNLCVSNLTVTNTISLPGVNIQLPICTNYPLAGDGTVTNCVDIVPGFCGSILQNINGAWDVFRSPGITEITVGNTGKPPGANFPDVASALGQNLVTNCRFIRITDDTTDGALNLPGSTLVYIDPGVTWTVTGPITLNGDFVLLGNQPFPSSRLVFGGQGAGAAIQGVGQLMIRDLHIQHAPQAAPNEILVNPTIRTRIMDVVVELGDTQGGFLSDATTPFANVLLDNVTLIGAGPLCSGIILINQAASQFASNMLALQGTFDLGTPTILCLAPSATWQGIRVQQNGQLVLTGTISDVLQLSPGAVTVTLIPESTVSNITVDTLVLSLGNAKVSNFQVQTIDVTGTTTTLGYSLSNGIIAAAFAGNDLRLTEGTQISNVTYAGAASLTTSVTKTCTISNFIMTGVGASLTLRLGEVGPLAPPPKRVQITNLQVPSDLFVDMYALPPNDFTPTDCITEISNAFVGRDLDIQVRDIAGSLVRASAC